MRFRPLRARLEGGAGTRTPRETRSWYPYARPALAGSSRASAARPRPIPRGTPGWILPGPLSRTRRQRPLPACGRAPPPPASRSCPSQAPPVLPGISRGNGTGAAAGGSPRCSPACRCAAPRAAHRRVRRFAPARRFSEADPRSRETAPPQEKETGGVFLSRTAAFRAKPPIAESACSHWTARDAVSVRPG